MNYLALDLEMNQPSGKIIQIGFAYGGKEGIYKKAYFVNPEEELTEFIVGLTDIKQTDVDAAPTLPVVWKQICDEYLSTLQPTVCGRFLNPLTWGGNDVAEIFKQLGHEEGRSHFGRRYVDVKTIFVAWRLANDNHFQGGLAKSMTKVGLAFEGRKHRADDDALNTLRMYLKLLEKFTV